MSAHHISRRNLVNLYRDFVRRLADGIDDDPPLTTMLAVAADDLDKAARYIEGKEFEALEQAELNEALKDEGK